MKNVENEALDLINALSSKGVAESVAQVKSIDPAHELKLAVFEAIKKRIHLLEEQDDLRKIAEMKLIEKIQSNEVSVPQLITIMNSIASNTTIGFDALLSPFKPVPNATPPLLTNTTPAASEEAVADFDRLEPAEKEALGKLIRLMNSSVR